MNFIIYTPLSETKRDFPSNIVTAFKSAESYEYCRNWQDIGEFTLVVPIDTPGIENVSDDMLLLVQDELNSDYLIITTIIDNGKNVTLKGYDLKVMLKWRITSHIYNNVGVITVKVKLLDTVSGTIGVKLGATEWSSSYNKAYNEQYIGARAYIGGSIESVQLSHREGVTHICFGEKVKSIFGSGMYQQKILLEMGIPPFIESIPDEGYIYNAIDYIYIPESCVSIGNYAFREHGASEIEIEEKGGTLTIGGYAFEKATSAYGGFNRVDVITIPARAVESEGTSHFFEYCNAGAIKVGRGRVEIPDSFFENAGASQRFSELCNRPYFIFIPKTVKSIGNNLLSYDNRAVYIVCEGSWSSITKASNWDGANGSRENVTIIGDYELYRSADKIINTFVRRC